MRITHKHCFNGKKSSEYNSWDHMIQRCNNKNCHKYQMYGGRGIRVCKRWLKFENFIHDMGLKPNTKYSIDRINTGGNYEPSNCRWATIGQQQINTRAQLRPMVGIKTNKCGTFSVRITVNKKIILLGTFKDIEEAIATRKNAEKLYRSGV